MANEYDFNTVSEYIEEMNTVLQAVFFMNKKIIDSGGYVDDLHTLNEKHAVGMKEEILDILVKEVIPLNDPEMLKEYLDFCTSSVKIIDDVMEMGEKALDSREPSDT